MKEAKGHIKRIDNEGGIYYERDALLGKGRFGEVFLGFDENRKKPIAVKQISLERLSNEIDKNVLLAKIKDEIVNLQIAKHEHIVELFDAKKSASNIYIITEYCNGNNLEHYIKERGYLPEFEALSYFQEILLGFKHLHDKNIVHRDLKPANLLIHNFSIKIADLGFSKSISGHEQLLQSCVGTPVYMSPQIFDQQKYTSKTDIWSLGLIFYEMLYGYLPWKNCHSLQQLKIAIKSSQIMFPSTPAVTKNTQNVIKQMLQVDEKLRVDWPDLFGYYLNKSVSSNKIEVQDQKEFEQFLLGDQTIHYFKSSLYLESHLQLEKIIKILALIPSEQLPSYHEQIQDTKQFFIKYKFLEDYKIVIQQYYSYFFQTRNQISFLMILLQRLLKLYHLQKQLENQAVLHAYLVSCSFLILKYSLNKIQMIFSINQQLKPKQPNPKIQERKEIKNCYNQFLKILLKKDRQIITYELQKCLKLQQKYLESIKDENMQIFSIITNDLSSLMHTKEGDQRILKFYLNNYLKKVYNISKSLCGKLISHQKSQMQDQSQEVSIDEHIQAIIPQQLVALRMIYEYEINHKLFVLGNGSTLSKEKSHQKLNLIQLLSEWEQNPKEKYYQKFNDLPELKQQMLTSFISKEFKWQPIIFSPLI